MSRATLSLEQKVGQMMVVGFEGLEAPDYLLTWIRESRVGGVILFARNVESPQQLAQLTKTLHANAPADHPLLICIDQEGGLVARLRDAFTESPGAMALGAAGSTELAERVSAVLAREMRALGINWNLAPVVDMIHNKENPIIGIRSLGNNAELVSELAVAEVRGFQDAHVAVAVKHFPGHGNTSVDTHVAAAVVTGPVEALFSHDLVPFRAAVEAGASAVMVGHVTFEAVDPDYPATLSPIVIQNFLRGQIGFQGVTCTDCMEMNAIVNHYGTAEAAALAALAGEDMILVSHTIAEQEHAYEGVLGAAQSGRLPIASIDAAVRRIEKMKDEFRFDGIFDTSVILHPEHLAVMQEAAQAGCVLVRQALDVLPVTEEDARTVGFVEFRVYRQTNVEDPSLTSDILRFVKESLPAVDAMIQFRDDPLDTALALAGRVDLLILAVRNLHLDDLQLERARILLKAARQSVVLCLRNPFDAAILPDAGTVICPLSDSKPSLRAAVDLVMGRFSPTGVLPVPIL